MNKKIIFALAFVTSFFCADCQALDLPLKILHISFHQGCLNDIEEVGRELGLDITSWYVLGEPRMRYDGQEQRTNSVYNITHDRAERVWNLNKNYFDQFDVIFTSDTTPLARVFLQNDWRKPLIIWVCNRFDYYDAASLDGRFPDKEYFDLIRSIPSRNNVRIISYTPYEQVYASYQGISLGSLMIRPMGCLPKIIDENFKSAIPAEINKSETLFLYPRLTPEQSNYVERECANVGLKTYTGRYNGPADLASFRGVIYFPYQWSNLALFEDIQQGIVHFVPSEVFINQLASQGKPIRYTTLSEFNLCEWYTQKYRDLIVYFDSWQDLKQKTEMMQLDLMRKKIALAGREHREEVLAQWSHIFSEVATLVQK